ncbi:LysR family transcriptional regulator, glycine cleavage system transcriptional activator [Pseudooceanicola antarcticus]|uniref:LysR family transcriptional regulator n=1 Tax=Pseudooceanicola antarcticus TaxID=1247613 RepID=A0A285I0N2_9RHOB|nr:LysR family transcriptional regulator [Pseudooceanicola antarcticus]PJE30268.1 LysR family transcriptional regulator [Pseudooceanicola antarcticus]SNY41542.1 LysR family transcriptional regulator, glycine cleavage system transcriptional activator [Pseudooceanicola antarcticus]
MIDWRSLPPLTALRALAALSETGSTVAAGARLSVSHAAVSQQVKALEEHLGLALVSRGGKALELTEEGRQLAQAVLAGVAGIEEVVRQLRGEEASRPVLVTCTPTLASYFLMPRLAEYQQAHPEVSLMIDPTPQLRDLGPGGADIALRYGNGTWPGLEAHLLVRSPVSVLASPELIPWEINPTPAELADYPWFQELGTNEASDFLEWQGARLNPTRGVTSLPGNLMIEALRSGRGVGPMARAFAEPDLEAGRLRLLHEDTRKKGYYLVTRRDGLRPAARDFARWVRRQARQSWGEAE